MYTYLSSTIPVQSQFPLTKRGIVSIVLAALSVSCAIVAISYLQIITAPIELVSPVP